MMPAMPPRAMKGFASGSGMVIQIVQTSENADAIPGMMIPGLLVPGNPEQI